MTCTSISVLRTLPLARHTLLERSPRRPARPPVQNAQSHRKPAPNSFLELATVIAETPTTALLKPSQRWKIRYFAVTLKVKKRVSPPHESQESLDEKEAHNSLYRLANGCSPQRMVALLTQQMRLIIGWMTTADRAGPVALILSDWCVERVVELWGRRPEILARGSSVRLAQKKPRPTCTGPVM